MNPLFEMLTGMQNNAATDQLAKQFGLQQDQVSQAMEALMPAFSQGLKRNAADPAGFAGFMQALAGGRHAGYFDNPADAFSQSGVAEGNAILGHLFGSKQVSRAITQQAETATGISQAILKQMLPAMAPMIMGGLFKQMTGSGDGSEGAQPRHFGGSSGNPFGRMLEELMQGGFGGAPGGSRPRSQKGSRGPLEEIIEQMTGGGAAQAGGKLGEIFQDMLSGGPAGQGGQGRGPMYEEDAWREPKYRDQQNRGNSLDDLFGDMFETGRKVNKQYQNSIESIFDEFLGPRR